jgi:hypothetical protein
VGGQGIIADGPGKSAHSGRPWCVFSSPLELISRAWRLPKFKKLDAGHTYANVGGLPILIDAGELMRAVLVLGIIFAVTGIIATMWGLIGLAGRLPTWATRHHPPVRVGLTIGIALVVVGVVLLLVALI